MASSSGKSQQPTGACNGTAADFPNIEQELYDYQMHTKMCKKIAQLTKVIYSLNTKNEEHEAALQSLREAHQKELRKVAEEAQGASPPCAGHSEEETEQRRHRQALEDSLEEQHRLRVEILADLDAYRQQVEERDLRTETEHSERIRALSQETLDLRKEFEGRLQSLSRLKEHLEQELERARQELRELQEECQDLRRSSVDERGRLEEVCQARTRALREDLEALREEKRSLEESSEKTVRELKEAQQEELEDQRRTMQKTLSDSLAQWQQREMEHWKATQASLQQKLKRVEGELEAKGQKLNENKRHSLKLLERIKDLEGQQEDGRRRVQEAEAGVKKAEEELTVAKERLLLQEDELLNKSEELMSQCSTQSRTSAEVEELRSQVCRLQQRAKELEQQSSGRSSDHARLVKQHTEALAAQRLELQRAQAEELRCARQQAEEERGRLKEQLRKAVEEVMRKHAGELRDAQTALDAERKKAQEDLRTQAEELKRRGEDERRELEKEKEDLQCQLQVSLHEISRLEAVTQRVEGAPEWVRLREELEQARRAAAQTKEDFELQEEKHQTEVSALKEEIIILEEAERNQEEKIRAACECLRSELLEQHLATLTRLQRDKDAEMKEMNERWQKKVRDLQTQLEAKKTGSGTNVRETGELFAINERDSLKQKIEETVTLSYSCKAQQEPTITEKEQLMKDQDFKEMEESAWQQHEEALRTEWHSHQQALRALEEQAQEELQAERHRQQAQQKLLLDRQKAELTQQHTDWCRQVTQRHMQQIEDLQAELRTHTELVALQQDFKQQNQVQAFERQLDECHSEVMGLRRQNSELKEQLATLHSQVECKTQELYKVQDTEQHQRRSWEEELLNRQHMEVECLKREHRKEIQTIVSDFSSAQTRLQARIVSLETELREKDENSKRRESRVEGQHVIGKLQDKLSERDQIIKRLMEERHQLQQHPQVASEKATLKAYENRPQPGSLTPTLRKKRMEDMPPRVTSVPNLSSYEKSFLVPDAAAGIRSPQAVKSPSFEHDRSASRTNTPITLAPEPRQGTRYRSPAEEPQQNLDNYSQPSRPPFEQRALEPGTEPQDPQRQEWFTKYFSF